jgi:hypothetical protein
MNVFECYQFACSLADVLLYELFVCFHFQHSFHFLLHLVVHCSLLWKVVETSLIIYSHNSCSAYNLMNMLYDVHVPRLLHGYAP